MTNKIAYRTILAAKAGQAEALESILRHYRPFIYSEARRVAASLNNKNGFINVNDDVVQRLKDKLVLQVIFKYDASHLPDVKSIDE